MQIKFKGKIAIDIPEFIEDFSKTFSNEINNVPDNFYDTFQYTTTGCNLTHPRTIGYITKILWGMENVINVDHDVRINIERNEKKIKFQPDIIVNYNCGNSEPLLAIDYESPNSSDARIPLKDVGSYLEWGESTPYIVITTLPKKEIPDWELRYTSKKEYNFMHKGKQKDIRKNPFEYWYKFYKDEIKKHGYKLDNIYFININGKEISFEKI